MESLGEMEVALQFYEMAQDYLSLVRVYCYCSNMDKVSRLNSRACKNNFEISGLALRL